MRATARRVGELWPTVLQVVPEATGHRSVRWGVHRRAAGCSARCQSGGLVRPTRPWRRLMRLRVADSWLAPQVLREDRLRVHLPNDRSAAGWKPLGHPGVQTGDRDPWPWLWRLLVETGIYRERRRAALVHVEAVQLHSFYSRTEPHDGKRDL